MARLKVVTIDGPAGAGKSTVASELARLLGWRLLDTGAMYRAVTLAAIRRGIDPEDQPALGKLAEGLSVRLPSGRVFLDDEDVTLAIRTVEVTRATRHAANSPGVRRCLIVWQREFARVEREVITEGRDQGTIVFPDALLKFYLTASDEERARRRHAEFAARDVTIPLEDVLRDLRERDAQDAARAIAPMKPADDAKIVDSTGMELSRVVEDLEREIRQRVSSLESPNQAASPSQD